MGEVLLLLEEDRGEAGMELGDEGLSFITTPGHPPFLHLHPLLP